MGAQDLTLRRAKIYGWVCPVTGDVVYVGKTSTPLNQRMVCHRGKARRHPKLPSELWLREQMDLGYEVEAIVLDECSVADSSRTEMEWIAHFGLDSLLNVRVGGHGNPCPSKIEWTPERVALLGKKTDADLARTFGCNRRAVSYRREILGISAVPKAMHPLPDTTITLPLDIQMRLGTEPDYLLARDLGVSKFVIAKHRKIKGISSYAEETGVDGRLKPGEPHLQWEPMPEWAVVRLGIVQDYLLAEELGWSVKRIGLNRRRRGIKAKRAKKWERSDLAGIPRKKRSDAGKPKPKRRVPG
jgi:hypothetical protein